MYNNPQFFQVDKQSLFPSPYIHSSGSFSTVPTPTVEEELTAARNILRSVISSTRNSPRLSSAPLNPPSCTPPLPFNSSKSIGVQTDPSESHVGLEGLIRAAGFSLANFATEIRTLERKVENRNSEILIAINELKNKKP